MKLRRALTFAAIVALVSGCGTAAPIPGFPGGSPGTTGGGPASPVAPGGIAAASPSPVAPTPSLSGGPAATSQTRPVPSGGFVRPSPAPSVAPTKRPVPPPVEGILVDYIYTSDLITPIAHLYGSALDDFAIVTVTNTNDVPAKVVVESEIVDYTTTATDTVTIDPGASTEVRQNPTLKPEAIDRLNSQRPADFHLHVVLLQEGQEREILDQTAPTLVWARRDFPGSIEGMTAQEVLDLLAVMVTPHDPDVEALIRKAADYDPSGIMKNGYGGHLDDAEGWVWDRMAAVWEAEDRDYDLTYISTYVTFAPGAVQRMRLPSEVLEQHSGNCIELAVLYAAVAEALGMEAAIVLIPGHAYVAIRTDLENANYYFIESTLIGRATFSEAVNAGAQEFDEAKPHLDAGDDGWNWVTIATAREKGILPIPWR